MGRTRARMEGCYASCEKRARVCDGFFATLMVSTAFNHGRHGIGHWATLPYVRSQGQPAVDAAALAAASAIPSGNLSRVTDRATKFNPGGTNPGTGNNYVNSPNNAINLRL
jgi:hypothetical protein